MTTKTLLRKTNLYNFTYKSYLFTFNRDYYNKLKAIKDLYGQFVGEGSLVFDVGANVGVNTECFLSLGASVIAVEPHPKNIERLQEIRSNKLTIVPVALSDKEAFATLHAGKVTDFSTLSEEFMNKAKNSPRFEGEQWDEKIEVPTSTLDVLIKRLGKPDFIKIDVEGHEEKVFDGLSSLPCPILFEFNSEIIDSTWRCLEKPCFSNNVEYNFALGDKIQLCRWVPDRKS